MAAWAEKPADTASKVFESSYTWNDQVWLDERATQQPVLKSVFLVVAFMSTIRRNGRSLRVAFTSIWGRYCKPSRIG